MHSVPGWGHSTTAADMPGRGIRNIAENHESDALRGERAVLDKQRRCNIQSAARHRSEYGEKQQPQQTQSTAIEHHSRNGESAHKRQTAERRRANDRPRSQLKRDSSVDNRKREI